MEKSLFNPHQKPRPFIIETARRNAVNRILLMLFALLLIPQGLWALDYVKFNTSTNQFEKATIESSNYTKDPDDCAWSDKTVVISMAHSYSNRIEVSGQVNIILCDGATLSADKGIEVPYGAVLTIYAQEKGTGVLYAQGDVYDSSNGYGTGKFYSAAIGAHYDSNVASGSGSSTCGSIVIHGGQITATSSAVDIAAGIGGCNSDGPLSLTVYGGKVNATGGKYGAGIGGGGIHGDSGVSSNGGTVSIYGGEVVATGGSGDAANVVAMGIGRGSVSNTATSGPSQGGLTLNTGVIYYGGTTANPTNKVSDGIRFQYMKTVKNYDLWVGSLQVTDVNKGNVFGDGKVSYNAVTNQLTLNHAQLNGGIRTTMSNLNIHIIGNDCSIVPDPSLLSNCILSTATTPGTLKFTKENDDDKLELDNSNQGYTVIRGFSTIDDVNGLPLGTAEPYEIYNSDGYIRLTNKIRLATDTTGLDNAIVSANIVYPLWLNSQQVTSVNASNILGSVGAATASFNTANNRLSLNGLDITGNIMSDLSNLIIQFVGTNKVNTEAQSSWPYGAADNAIFSCNPSAALTFQKSGDGTLELDGKNTPKSAVAGFASVSYGVGCYLKTDVPTKYSSDDKCYINFANGNAFVDVVTISTDVYYPLWIGTSTTAATQVTTTNITTGVTEGTVTFTPAIGTTSSKLSLSDATIEAKILSALGNLVIEVSGKNTISSPDSGTVIRSVNEGTLTLERAASIASLELKTNLTDNTKPVIQGFHTLSYNTSFDLNTSATTPTYGIFYSMYGLFDAGPGGIFAIMQATFAKNYGLSIAGTQVTSANAGNVFAGTTNDGKVTFLPDANTTNAGTLKLNGLQITGDITSGLAELTIEISGDNTLHASSTISEDGHIIGTATAGTLTFTKASGATGTSSLELKAANSYSVIQGFTSVTAGNDVYFQYGNPYEYNTTDKKMAWLDGSPVQGFLVTTQPSYPLWIDSPYTHGTYQAIDGNVSVGGDVIPFTVSGTTYTLTLNNIKLDYQHIISDLDNLTIELVGTNTMNDSDPTVHSDVNPIIESLNNSATLTFKKSGTGMASLEMSNDASGSSIISGFNSVVVETGLFWTASGTITYDSTNGLLVGTTPAHNATIGVQGYPLWIGSTQVTSANAGNIRNDGTLSYVHDATNNTGTLTLNGVTLNGGDISTSMSDLTIHVKGNNKISAASNCIRSSATTPGKLTFTKDTGGKLELDNASNGYSVIKGFNELDGVPLETKAPYEIYINGDYYRLKQLFVAAGDTASIDYAWVYADTTYPIWVDGHQATSVSANNILGDAGSTASFNSNTLTLNVANIPGAIVSSLTSTLTISVKGNSTVSGGIFQTSNATADLVVSKDATATGNVSLLVNPGREAAIRGFSSFTYTDFVPFNSSGTTDLSDGISYESNALKYNGTALGAVYLLSKTDLATAGLTFTMASVAYTGAAVVLPTTATMDNGTTQTTLTQTTDYIVTGYKASDKTALTSAPIAAGNYYATIQGNGIYTGTADAAFTIDQADFTPPSVISIAAVTAQTYTGLEIKPTPTVTFGSTQLTAGTDFDYSYANNTNAALSTATPAPTVTINGKGNFKGANSVTFTINPKSVVGLEVNVSGTYTYTGSAIQPTSIEVKDGSKTLTSGTDYTIYTYSNNVDVADANDPTAPPTVTIKGMGNYDSKTTENGHFTIAQADFTTTTLLSIAAVADQTYTGSEITPTPAVTFNGTTLTAGTDFEYDYANNTDAASSSATPAPTVIVNGKGSFTGSKSVNFTINPKSIRGTTVAVSGSYTYSGAGIVPPAENVTVTDGTKVLQNGKDYTYGCSSNINAGTATITVTGMGNYATTTTENGTFTIDPATITDVEVGATEFEYAPGDTKTVTITKVSAGSLVLGTSDYSLSGTQSAIAVGSYQFTVTGTGNFQGFKNVDWKINERPANITFKTGHTFRTFYDASEDFLVPDGVTAYIVTGVNDNSVTVTKVSYIQAGVPVLLESTSGSTIAKDPSETFAGNLLNYADRTVVTDGNQYVLYSDEFVKATGTIDGKVFLDLTGLPSPARAFVIRTENATAIEDVFGEEADGDAKWYDMQGRRINKPNKAGLYIKDGKKVVVNKK